ncbi:MAG: TetR/AcrR family transcriptional regulator [Acidimicrobiales bacterium]|nr:TetR/AcrR family transcriptional regulator [Acidimicrobiales bacterium]
MSPPGRSRSPRGQGEQLREEILEAAQSLLMETASEDAVSIRAVADAVGVTPPSIYRHFADKDRLLLEVCRLSFERFTDVLEDAFREDHDPRRRIEGMGRAYVRYAVDNPEHYRIMFMARFELTTQEYAEEMVTDGSSFDLLLRTADELVTAGLVRPELADRGALTIGMLFWANVHGLASLLVAKPGLPWPDRDRLIDDLVTAATRGILLDPR